jgi:acyl carrier protein
MMGRTEFIDGKPVPMKLAVLQRLEEAAPKDRQDILIEFLKNRAIKVLGLSPTYVLDTRRPLNEMGLDSLMAMELKNAIDQAVGRKLPPTLVFEYPTIEAISSYLLREVIRLEKPAESQIITPPLETIQTTTASQRNATISQLEQISDEEAEAILLEKLAKYDKAE